jgi:hypothetical protein
MICAEDEHGILSCVFYDGIGHEWIAKDLLFTGHKDGVIRVLPLSHIKLTAPRFGVDTFAKDLKLMNHPGN